MKARINKNKWLFINLTKMAEALYNKEKIELSLEEGGLWFPLPSGEMVWYPAPEFNWDDIPDHPRSKAIFIRKMRIVYGGEWEVMGTDKGPVAQFRNRFITLSMSIPKKNFLVTELPIFNAVKQALEKHPAYARYADLQEVVEGFEHLTEKLIRDSIELKARYSTETRVRGKLTVTGRFAGQAITFTYSKGGSFRISREAFLDIKRYIKLNKGNVP